MPIELKTRKGTTLFDRDEHPRADASVEGMAKLRAVFKKDGTVTAGNASGINDGAAAVRADGARRGREEGPEADGAARLLRSRRRRSEDHGHRPGAGVEEGAREGRASRSSRWTSIESNEAFAVQALAVSCDLKLDPKKTNPNGGAVGLGHPIGATGAVLTVKALYELQRIGGRYALVTMCIGGGQGIAAVFERLQ